MKRLIAKYDKQENSMYCPECKSYEVMCDGTGTLDLPVGFGFLQNDTKFSVAKVRLKGYIGECMECQKEVFNYTSKRAFNTYPKALNKKLGL